MNPFYILGVPPDADDQTIRKAYLEAIKKATPETNPERFQTLSRAYETVRTETDRNRYQLLHVECSGESPLDAFVQYSRWRGNPQPIPWEAMKKFLRSCINT